MAALGISDGVKNFIYTYVDSIELLEVLLIFQKDAARAWTVSELARDLRSTPASIGIRVSFLESAGFVTESDKNLKTYQYQPASPELRALVAELASIYEVRRHKIYELIYSPMKKARDFADAFFLGEVRKSGRTDE